MIVENWNGKGEFNPCSSYDWRLNWLENQILIHRKNGKEISSDQYQRWFEEEEKVYQNNKRDLEKIKKLKKPLAIVVPAHYYHVPWLWSCLRSCQATGYFTILAYDNPVYSPELNIQTRMPDCKTLYEADMVMIKHKTWGSGVGIPHAWNMFYTTKMIEALGFEYTFNINGDCIMQKPEGLEKIFKMVTDLEADFISCEWFPKRKYCGTMSWLSKTKIAVKVWSEYIRKLYHFNFGNAEARMGRHILEGGYKVVEVENPEEAHFKPPGVKGTWREVLGFRHLHAEHKVKRSLEMEPVEKELWNFGVGNIYMNGHEKATLLKYYETGYEKYLRMWWDK